MTAAVDLPPGSRIRVTKGPGIGGRSQIVLIIAPPGLEAATANLVRRGRLTAAISFDAGASWPDRIGATMASDALAHAEIVVFEFVTLADALRCEARLRAVQ